MKRMSTRTRASYAGILLCLVSSCGEGSKVDPPGAQPSALGSTDALARPSATANSSVMVSEATAPSASASTATADSPAANEPPRHARPPRSPKAHPPGDRIYAKSRFTWIKRAPSAGNGWIGYLTLGGSVRLYEGDREKAKILGPGCNAWYRVEPMGFVCEGADATLDPADPDLVRLVAGAPDVDSPFPYAYAESLGAPRYGALPSEKEQAKREVGLDKHKDILASIALGTPAPAKYTELDLTPAGRTAPDWPTSLRRVREARDFIAPGSTLAYFDSFDAEGRTWLVTSDHALVPKDKTKPYPESSFQGVELTKEVRLPIAFFRKKNRPQYRRVGEAFEPNEREFARLSWVMLTGERAKVGAVTYLETRTEGVWVREEDAAVAAEGTAVPYRNDEDPGGHRTWLDISILGGTLVAYEDKTPVFTTLIAPGRGGPPVPGHDALSTASTPTGTFRVDGKFKSATMVSSTDDNIVHAEVQYVQNFHGPHALHGAYWHDGWGEPKSGGCVNLSPIDSRRVFGWTEPKIPTDWHGMRSIPELGKVTRVVVRR